MLVRCDDSWVTGFWRYKGQYLNVQLYINSFILVIALSKWPKYKLHDKEWLKSHNVDY